MEILVTKICRITFSIRKQYICEILCDIIDMDVGQIIFGRTWQYDIGATYDCRHNTYFFDWKSKKIMLLPFSAESKFSHKEPKIALHLVAGNALLASDRVNDEILALTVIDTQPSPPTKAIPDSVQHLLKQFQDISPIELPAGLPPLRNIQHQIEFTAGAILPNIPHHKMTLRA